MMNCPLLLIHHMTWINILFMHSKRQSFMLSHAVDNFHLLLPVASFHVTYFIQLTDHLTVNYGWSHSLTSNEIYVPQFLNRLMLRMMKRNHLSLNCMNWNKFPSSSSLDCYYWDEPLVFQHKQSQLNLLVYAFSVFVRRALSLASLLIIKYSFLLA